GFFVELDNMPVEGMVRVETLGRDYYVYDEERQELRGEHSGETFRLGQRVTVKLTGVHVGRLEIDLEYQKDEEGRRPFRRKDDDRAPRRPRPEGKFGKRRDDREDGEHRTGRRAFADRKGFRPRFEKKDDELARQRRYASDSWGGEDEGRDERKPRFERENGFKKPFGSRFHKDEDGRDFRKPRFQREDRTDGEERGEGRPFRKPFGNRFDREDGERRPFRDHGFRPRFEKKPWDNDGEMNENGEERSFRKPRFEREEGERSFRKPFGSRFQREGEERGEGRPFRKDFNRDDREGGFKKPFGSRFHKDGEGRSFGEKRFDREERGHGKFDKYDRDHGKKKFHGAPDDFFRMDTENEKPVHRFGKRSK
ncbi:MAG: S1 RNA-binding domain-containing protein, partial [Kiritimatiellae bacterium]|nr:S1 RNA-binding domain-containing protein [Kiritimatiellia bacterium]